MPHLAMIASNYAVYDGTFCCFNPPLLDYCGPNNDWNYWNGWNDWNMTGAKR